MKSMPTQVVPSFHAVACEFATFLAVAVPASRLMVSINTS
jgi:hypothetical protein